MQIPSIVDAIQWIFEPLGDVVTLENDTSDLAHTLSTATEYVINVLTY